MTPDYRRDVVNGPPAPTRLARWALRVVSSRDRAAAILGDIAEDVSKRAPLPRASSLWIEQQTWRFVGAEAGLAAGRCARAASLALRDAWRSIRAAPRQTAVILGVLTLGIAAATVTFSVVDAVVLRPLPVADQDRLVVVTGRTQLAERMSLSPEELIALRQRAHAFAAIAGINRDTVDVGVGDAQESVPSARTTADLFTVLGVAPVVGRAFSPEAERPGRERVVVLSHDQWTQRFGGDPAAIGRTLILDGDPHEVVGVMPPGFTYPIVTDRPVQLWLPYVVEEGDRWGRELHVVGRLRADASVADAQTQVDTVTAALAPLSPRSFEDWRPEVSTLVDSVLGDVRRWMLLVLAAVGLVLLVVCFNVASLLLTRAAARVRDQSIRASLGASGRQLAGALAIESLLLSCAATGLALLIATWGVEAARSALPSGIVRAQSIALDLRVFAAAAVAAGITGVLFGLAPAISTLRIDIARVLRLGARTATPARNRCHGTLLVAEVAFICVLLVATTLFVASFVRVTTADLGFDRSRLVSLGQLRGYSGAVPDVVRQLAAVAGVEAAAAMVTPPPLVGGVSASTTLQPPDDSAGAPVTLRFQYVSSEYFATARIPILQGATFAEDDAVSPAGIVIDELAARRLFGTSHAIGRIVRAPRFKAEYRVIGIVAHVRVSGPEEDSGPQMYMQIRPGANAIWALLRTAGNPHAALPSISASLEAMLPNRRVPPPIVVDDQFRRLTATRRFNAAVMSLFGVLAVVLGAAGIYGVMSITVSEQTRDFGIRRALGATSSQIQAAVVGRTIRYLATGLAIGLASAWWVSRLFDAVLFEVSATDVWVYTAVAAILGLVGLGAAILPARRAARVDPLVALRAE